MLEAFLSFAAALLRPRTMRSASSRVASGVKVRTPSAMRCVITGAPSQRGSGNWLGRAQPARVGELAADGEAPALVAAGDALKQRPTGRVELNPDDVAAEAVLDPRALH